MATNNDIPDLAVFGSGRGDFRLPCGYVDEKGRVFNHIYLKEQSGVEDDIMDDDELNVSERMSRVIANCTEKLTTESNEPGSAITDRTIIDAAVCDQLKSPALPFSIPDRMACLLFLRRISVGDKYDITRKCPECEKPLKDKHIMLSSLKIYYCKDATKRRVKVKLPRSGKEAVLRVLSASGERRIAEMRVTMKDAKSAAILARLESIDGQMLSGNNEKDMAAVKALSKLDRKALIDTFNAMEGSIETEVEVKCDKVSCGAEFKFDLDLGQIFFSNPESGIKAETLTWM